VNSAVQDRYLYIPPNWTADIAAVYRTLNSALGRFDSYAVHQSKRKHVRSDNEYMRKYMQRRWERRRLAAIESLGGQCVQCASTESLQFDHIDPSTKSFTLSQRPTASEESFQIELAKCQLLCHPCHRKKTAWEQSRDARLRYESNPQICPHCKTVIPYESRYVGKTNSGRRKFCTRDCYYASKRKNMLG
jgi:5-methylcytosine-specific restriction endonuclease McrA